MPAPEKVALGTLVLDCTNFEVPEDLELGDQTLGGVADIPQTDGKPAQRVSQTLGVVPKAIRFDAWFLSDAGQVNADKLRALQKAQAVVRFQRGVRSYDVVIYDVTLKYHSAHEIAYTVELEPLNEASATSGTRSSSSRASDHADAINALLAAAPADVRLTASISGTSSALTDLAALGPADAVAIPDLSARVIAMVAQIDYLQALRGQLAGSTLGTDVSTYLFASQLSGALSTLVASLGRLTGAKSPLASPGGMNLYEFAVYHTGDIGNADAILAANPSVTDPFNLGPAPLAIPGLS